VHAIDERLDVALHDRERRAELVGHVCQQAPALALAALQPRAHRVEGIRERAERTRAAGVDAHCVVAALDAFRRVDEIAERRGVARDAVSAHVEHDHQDEEAGEDEHEWMRTALRGRAEDVDEHEDEDRDQEREEHERHEGEERHTPHEARTHAPPIARRERLVRRPPRRRRIALAPATPPRGATVRGSLVAHLSSVNR
jgi:hypothetical protein